MLVLYDIEQLTKDIINILKNNLNNEIVLVNAEDNRQDFSINQISITAYYPIILKTMDSISNNEFIVYSFPTLDNLTQRGDHLAVGYSIDILIYTKDALQNNEEQKYYKILRYQRALLEAFKKNWKNGAFKSSPLTISAINPNVTISDLGAVLTTGVTISTTYQ